MTLFTLSLIWVLSGHGSMIWNHSRDKKRFPTVTDDDVIKDCKLVPYVVLSSMGLLTFISILFCVWIERFED